MKKEKMSLIMTMLLFGSIGLFVKGMTFSSSQIAMARGIIGCISLLVAAFLLKKRISLRAIKANFLWLTASGIAIGLNWIFLFEAYKYTSVSIATICYYFAPVIVLFAAPFLLKEKLTGKKIICILAAMAGMVLITINGSGIKSSSEMKGIIFGLIAAMLYASVIIMNKFLKDISGIDRTVFQLGAAAVAIAPYTLLTEGFSLAGVAPQSIVMLLVVGIIHTGIAYLVYFTVMEKLESQTIAVYSYIDPIAAIILSAIVLGEQMTLLQAAGGILILGATFLSEVKCKKASLSSVRKETIMEEEKNCHKKGEV